MAITGKLFSNIYKDLIIIDNSNAGFDANIDQVKTGEGSGSALYLSTNNVKIQPTADSTTNTAIYDKDGNVLVAVDATNDTVKALGHHVNTNYSYFGIDHVGSAAFVVDTHYALGHHVPPQIQEEFILGTGTNPDTSKTLTADTEDIVTKMWYAPDALTIDSASFFLSADTATGDTVRCHLMVYDIDKRSGVSTGGDLTNGVVVADGVDITSAGYEQTDFQEMTIQNASVSSGQVLFFTFRQDGVNSDYSISATIKYHLT